MKILLVEDEVNVASFIRRGLSEAGYNISIAMDGDTGRWMISENGFDLLILDVMLPGISGLELCRTLRKQKYDKPILMLTALGTTENIVAGLESGADDYLVKPFKLEELIARIRSLSRRAQGQFQSNNVLQISDLQMDLDSKIVKRGDKTLSLTATEFRLLEYMLKNSGKVLSRIDILENVWSIDFNLGTNVVDVYVNYLRKKVDKDFPAKLIHTVIGMGYMLNER